MNEITEYSGKEKSFLLNNKLVNSAKKIGDVNMCVRSCIWWKE